MKVKEKSSVSEKHLLNHIDSLDREVDRHVLEHRAKKNIASNPLIQKNIGFLQNYNNLFRKSSLHPGDTDSCFRKSLRSFSDNFDIIQSLNLEKSVHIHKKKKKRSVLTQPHYCDDFIPLLKTEDFWKPLEEEKEEQKSFEELYNKDSLESNFQSESDEGGGYFSPLEAFKSEPEDQFEELPEDKELKENELTVLTEEGRELEDELPLLTEEDRELEDERTLTLLTQEGRELLKKKYYSSEDSLLSAREALESIYKMAEEFAGDEEMNLEEAEKEVEVEVDEDEEFEEGEDDELKDVEEMIQQASEELQKVAEENQQMMETLEEGDEEEETELEVTEPKPEGKPKQDEPKSPAAGGDSVFKFDPAIDAALLQELEEAEKQAKATAAVITALKTRVGELLTQETMTETEAKELEAKNKELKAQMILFEQKTKRIQFLLGQTNLFDKMQPVHPALQVKHPEDVLPKMLVCGVPDDFVPKIVMCHQRSDKTCRPRSSSRDPASPIAKKLNESYNMQEQLVNENAQLEGTRYQLQSDLINKDQTVDHLQRQLCCLQNEMRMVYQENAMLNDRFQQQQQTNCPNPTCPKNSRSSSPTRGKKPCGPGYGVCPADVENRLQQYSNTTSQLEKQLTDVEQDVKNIQQELQEVQKEREHLEHHRRMLAVPVPCPSSYPCPPPPPCGHPPCGPPPPCGRLPCCPPEASGEDQQYKELKEKYHRLVEDFKVKLTEVAGLRADNEKLKELAEKAEESRSKLELKVKELEKKLKDLRGDGDKGIGSKEQLVDLQQQLKVHKELYRQAQDELEELRALIEDIQAQLNDYRNKYLEAIQTVEEQRRQIEIMRMENNRISEQVNLEILRVKNQFQEKLQELAPLPDILKATQTKLQEAQQMHLLAERNNEALAKELQTYKDKLEAINEEMALSDRNISAGADEKEILRQRVKELEQELLDNKSDNDDLRIELERLKEIADENEHLANEKLHEIAQLETQLENVREESARQVARIKDRCEIVRKSTQNQVSDLERQLAQTKANAKAAEKDRDEIRQKMHAQIRNLNENFEDAQMRIRNLQGHVNFLKNSYCSPSSLAANVVEGVEKADPCHCEY